MSALTDGLVQSEQTTHNVQYIITNTGLFHEIHRATLAVGYPYYPSYVYLSNLPSAPLGRTSRLVLEFNAKCVSQLPIHLSIEMALALPPPRL